MGAAALDWQRRAQSRLISARAIYPFQMRCTPMGERFYKLSYPHSASNIRFGQAEQARRIAQSINDPETAEALRKLADDYEEQAKALIAGTKRRSPRIDYRPSIVGIIGMRGEPRGRPLAAARD